MKLTITMTAAVILLAIVPQAKAETKLKEAITWGVGVTQCAEYVRAYHQDPQINDIMFGSWMQGYYSGLNLATNYSQNQYRNLATYNVFAMTKWVRKYCAQHPKSTFMDGATELGTKLPILQNQNPSTSEPDIPYNEESNIRRDNFR
jgi:hypothetical protein